MKILILLFFVFLTPLFVLLLTIFYGGLTPSTLKNSLSESEMYPQISTYIAETIQSDEDNELNELSGFITDRFTAEYIQQKTELAIEDSHAWIVGESTVAPVVSFSELKDDLLDKNPGLLKEIESISMELKESSSSIKTDSLMDEERIDDQLAEAQLSDTVSSFSAMINQDFSIKLEPYLVGVKGFYDFSKILLPVTLLLMIGSLILLGFLSQSWKSRFKWIGSTLMVSGIVGFCIVFFNNLLISLVSNYLSNSEEKGVLNIFLPATVSVFKTILDANNNYQLITSITLFIIAAGLFVAASINKDRKAFVQPVKTSKKKSL